MTLHLRNGLLLVKNGLLCSTCCEAPSEPACCPSGYQGCAYGAAANPPFSMDLDYSFSASWEDCVDCGGGVFLARTNTLSDSFIKTVTEPDVFVQCLSFGLSESDDDTVNRQRTSCAGGTVNDQVGATGIPIGMSITYNSNSSGLAGSSFISVSCTAGSGTLQYNTSLGQWDATFFPAPGFSTVEGSSWTVFMSGTCVVGFSMAINGEIPAPLNNFCGAAPGGWGVSASAMLSTGYGECVA